MIQESYDKLLTLREVYQAESARRGLGTIEDWKQISDRRDWQKCLEAHCAELKGHRGRMLIRID